MVALKPRHPTQRLEIGDQFSELWRDRVTASEPEVQEITRNDQVRPGLGRDSLPQEATKAAGNLVV